MALTDIRIIDTDSHVMEPPDLWTSRMSQKKWGDRIPHLFLDERRDEMRWLIGGESASPVSPTGRTAGWHEPPPSHPRTLEEAEPGAWDPTARLARMGRLRHLGPGPVPETCSPSPATPSGPWATTI